MIRNPVTSLLRVTTHPYLQIPEFLQITRGFWSSYNQSRLSSLGGRVMREAKLQRLAASADLYPNDAMKQADYLEALNDVNPQEVIKRYDSGQFAKDDRVHNQYLRALQLIGNVKPNNYAFQNANQPNQQFYQQQQYYQQQQPYQQQQQYYSNPYGQSQFVNYNPSNPNPGTFDLTSLGSKDRPLWVAQKPPSFASVALNSLFNTLLLILAVVILLSLSMRLQGGGAGQKGKGGFGGLLGGSGEFTPIIQTHKTFKDVKGIDACKDEIMEIVEFLKSPEKFTKLGGKLPKGVLLVGSPGTGKTLLAKAIAGEAGVPFFFCAGSEFDEMFVGVGAQRVRSLFAAARKKAPCIIFIDEIDSLGGKRTARDPFYSKQSLNQLLTELDGFNASEGIIVIGATNFVESLDAALIRPGRFDKQIEVPLPDVSGRKDILQLYLEKVPVAKDFSIHTTAQKTMGFSGAELENLINIASIRACTKSKNEVSNDDIDFAFDRIVMGIAHKTKIDEEDKKRTAYHECGHALMTLFSSSKKKGLHKVTVIPRGRALGYAAVLPTDDSPSVTKQEYLEDIDRCLGGIVAEEIIYGRDFVTSGASNDLQQATKIARAMVTKFGMSDKLGLLDYDSDKAMAEDTRREIDMEVRNILQSSYEKVKKTLMQHENELRKLAVELIKYETLSGKEVMDVLDGKPVIRDEHNEVSF